MTPTMMNRWWHNNDDGDGSHQRGHQGDSLLHCAASTAQIAIVNFCLQVAHASVDLRLTFTIQLFCRPESSLTLSTVSLRLLCIKWESQWYYGSWWSLRKSNLVSLRPGWNTMLSWYGDDEEEIILGGRVLCTRQKCWCRQKSPRQWSKPQC